jgi:thiosulfate reductase cytochrome b subunit
MSNTALFIIAIALIVGGAIGMRAMREEREESDARSQLKPILDALGQKETNEEEAYWARVNQKLYWSGMAVLFGVMLLLYVGCEAMKSSY